jgi:hypothetical protein
MTALSLRIGFFSWGDFFGAVGAVLSILGA